VGPMRNLTLLKYVLGITFSLYVVLCFFNQPSYDDFTYAVSTSGKTFWEAQRHWYTTWSGRYTATALLTFNPLVFHWMYGYKLLSLAVVLGLLCTVHVLVKTYLHRLPRSAQWFATLLLTSFYFSLLPHLAGGIYWMAGSMTHAVPTILAGLSIALLKRKGTSVMRDYLLLPFMTFLIVGSNETIMFLWMSLLLLGNAYVLCRQKKVDPVLAVLFVAGLAGSLIVISAPGNTGRSMAEGTAPRPLHDVVDSGAYAFVYLFKFASVPFGLFLIWMMKNARTIQEKLQWHWIDKRSLALTFFVLFLTQFCTFFPSLWAMNTRPPRYVYNMSVFFYLPLSVLTVMQFALMYPQRAKFADRFHPDTVKAVIIFCVLFVLLGNNGRALYDIVAVAPHYNAQLNDRYRKMEKSTGKDVKVEELSYKPKSLFYSDIGSDPLSGKNKTYAEYFHLKSVATESSDVKRIPSSRIIFSK
jgi:hypothetical protein